MRRLFLLIAILATPAALHGQATADQARLIFTLGLGQTDGGAALWTVDQPVSLNPGFVDTLGIGRAFRNSLNVVFSGTYFRGDHLGFNVEAQLLGLGTRDRCSVVGVLQDSLNDTLCRSVNGVENVATSTSLSVGVVYRIGSRQPVHPYVRANVGLVISPQSFIETNGEVPSQTAGTAEVRIFNDASGTSVQPYGALGGGVIAVIGHGYQLRFEVRDNWVRVPVITGPSSTSALVPQRGTAGKHLLSFTIGFDVVLERKRGRRY
jgi:hypothetical protein